MKKIPTMFVRDPATNLRHVKDKVSPGCEWVFAGEGYATRKYDGTSVLMRNGEMLKRREIKEGRPFPDYFELVETDANTGKSVGWVPVEDGPEDRWHREAYDHELPDGTYELCGPKVQGNPEGFDRHTLVLHGVTEVDAPRTFAELAVWLHGNPYEGVVFHHPDGRMAKIKKRDFPND